MNGYRYAMLSKLYLAISLSGLAGFSHATSNVNFTAIQCEAGVNPGTINSGLIAMRAASDTTLTFPTGKFSLEPLTLTGLNNFIMVGTQPSGPLSRGTRLVFNGGSGLTFVNGGTIALDSLEIEAPLKSDAVKIAGSGSLHTPSLLVTSTPTLINESCLSVGGAWLSPVMNLLLN